jgi:hypothetical protein
MSDTTTTTADARPEADSDSRSLAAMMTILVVASVAFLSQALPYVA